MRSDYLLGEFKLSLTNCKVKGLEHKLVRLRTGEQDHFDETSELEISMHMSKYVPTPNEVQQRAIENSANWIPSRSPML